ncbi:MAG: hypothetical protein OHK0019_38520 [Saprospiraceae bacterium]
MEPVTTTAMIGTVVGYLAKTLKDNKSIQDFFKDFTDAAVAWIRPVFLKDDDSPKEVLENLKQNPDSQPRQDAVKNAIAIALEENPQAEKWLKEMSEVIRKNHPDFFRIDNTGASIGQQNIGSTVTNTGANFNIK